MRELTIEITNRCSLNCLHCSTEAGPNGKIFFSENDIESILEKYSDFEKIRISGGEPFEHPKIEKIAKLIHDKKKVVDILSCGVFQKHEIPIEKMQRIKPHVSEIIFSYHGFYNLHDSIVSSDKEWYNQPPYWDMLCDSTDNALLAEIPYSFQTVLMKDNFDELENIAKDMHSFSRISGKKTKWHILRFVKQGRGLKNKNHFVSENYAKKLPEIAKDFAEKYKIDVSFTRSFAMEKCECGSMKSVITCKKEEIPCSALKGHSANKGKRFPCLERV